LNKIWVKIGLV